MSRVEQEKKSFTADGKARKTRQRSSSFFNIVAGLVVIALLGLAVSIAAPNLFDRVFRSSPLQRGGTVMTIGEYEVSSELYLYVALTVKNQYTTAYGENIFEKDPSREQEVLIQVENTLISKACWLAFAEQEGIVLTPEGEEAAAGEVQKIRDLYSTPQEYQDRLNELGVSEDLLYTLECEKWVMSRLQEEIYNPSGSFIQGVTDADREAFIAENGLMSAEHILINGSTDAAQNTQKLRLAESLLAQLRSGADFESLAGIYTEDEHSHDPFDQMFIASGSGRPTEYIAAVESLEIGALSDVVTVDYGDGTAPFYYIILRTPPDSGVLTEVLVEQSVETEMEVLLEGMDVTYARGYKYIRMEQIVAKSAEPEDEIREDSPSDTAA